MSRSAAMKVVKFLLVIGLMALVFRSVQWDDRLLTKSAGGDAVEETVSIRGAWSSDRVVVIDSSGNERTLQPGKQADGSELELAPGFLTYWRNLDVTLFVLGAACYFVTVLVAGARWWWLLRVNGLQVTLLESLRFTWIGVFFNTVVPGATGGDLIKAIYIMKHCPGQRVPALVSVIVDRVLGLASLAILGAVSCCSPWIDSANLRSRSGRSSAGLLCCSQSPSAGGFAPSCASSGCWSACPRSWGTCFACSMKRCSSIADTRTSCWRVCLLAWRTTSCP